MLLRLFILSLFITFSSVIATSQNVDPSTIDVNNLSDGQIRRLVEEANKRGLSQQEAIAMAKARGMSQEQINALEQRIADLGDGKIFDTKASRPIAIQKEISVRNVNEQSVNKDNIENKVFGNDFFNNENLSFEPNISVPVGDSYVLGPGDEVLIDVWGASEMNYQLEVDRNGFIVIPQLGPINVGNLSFRDVREIIEKKLSQIYIDLKSSIPKTFSKVFLGELRNISINIIGEVQVPGTYVVPATATAFNALYLCGGPNEKGSYRDIQVIRNGQKLFSIDVYDFLLNGNTIVNIPLRDNDVILVPTYNKKCSLEGHFKRTGIFESKEGETIDDIINYAGGYSGMAYKNSLKLYRNSFKERKIIDLECNNLNKIEISDGDKIFCGKILSRFENRVSITGAVYRPGSYELSDSLTLSGLIRKADGIREDAFLNRGLITRLKEDLAIENIPFNVKDVLQGDYEIVLKREDEITILSINDLREERFVTVYGEVNNPGVLDYQDGLTLSDVIFKTGGLKESASQSYIEISRRLNYEEALIASDEMAHVFQFSISRELSMNGEDAKFALQPFDQIFIRRSPGFEDKQVVKILGEVKYAGDYSLKNKKETISDLIKRSGGLSNNAYAEGAMLTRKVILSPKELRLREELLKKDSTLSFTNLDFGIVSINLAKILRNPGSKDDLYLQDGDELVIPEVFQTVKVSGEVLNPIASTYEKGRGLKYYINQGGGFGLRAKKRKVYVIYPHGAASATKGFLFFRKYPKVSPGTEIVVPEKPYKTPMPAVAWVGLGSAFATMSLTIVSIVNTLNK